MNKNEYLRILSEKIGCLPHDEYCNIMEYYTEYFEDAENEQSVIEELGSPENLAERIIRENSGKDNMGDNNMYGQNIPPYPYSYPQPQSQFQEQPQKQGLSNGWKIFIIVITFPLWFGALAALGGMILGFSGASIGCFVGAMGALITGFTVISTSVPIGVFIIGASFIVLALSIGFVLVVTGIVHLLVKLVRFIFLMKKQQTV